MHNDSINHSQDITGKAAAEKPAGTVQLFRSGRFHFGVPANEVTTITEWREPTPLPHAPESVLGVVSIQGRMLTVLNPALLAETETAFHESNRHIIALGGDEQLALAVSEIDELIEHETSPNTVGTKERFVLEVLQRAGVEVRILNVAELFSAALQGRERRRRRF